LNEVAAADVVSEIAEEFVAVGIVAEVLNDGATIGEGMSFAKIVGSGVGIAFEEEFLNIGFPCAVDDGFVGEDGIGLRWRRGSEC
jgi:hypothetical protein